MREKRDYQRAIMSAIRTAGIPGSYRELESELPLLGIKALKELLQVVQNLKAETSRAKQRGMRGF